MVGASLSPVQFHEREHAHRITHKSAARGSASIKASNQYDTSPFFTLTTMAAFTLTPFLIENRPDFFPEVFLVNGEHPLRRDPRVSRDGAPIGRTFVMIQDTSMKGMLKFHAAVKALEVPNASIDDLERILGMLPNFLTAGFR